MELAAPLQDYPLLFITDRSRSLGRDNLKVVRAALEGGCRWIMYRDPEISDAEFYDECLKLADMCEDANAGLIVNDRLDIAALTRAEGVHLGKNDLPVKVVKEYMGEDFLVGYSAHTLEDALTAEWEGADYITFSPIFPLTHKESPFKPHGIAGAKKVLEKVRIPVFLLGGIRLPDLSELTEKIDSVRVATVSMISAAEDIIATTEEVLQMLGAPAEREEGDP